MMYDIFVREAAKEAGKSPRRRCEGAGKR